MKSIQPNALDIDKNAMECNAFMKVIECHIWSWEDHNLRGNQKRCKILLCTLHLKHALIEHTLNKVPVVKQKELYDDVIGLSESCAIMEFDFLNKHIDTKYGENP